MNNNYININNALTRFKELTCRRIDDKFIVVHPKYFKQIKKILDEENIIIDIYEQSYCDIDKVYLIDKIDLHLDYKML